MASIFRWPGKNTWWITYYHNGKRHRRSLKTTIRRIAARKQKKIEADLITGEIEHKSVTLTCPHDFGPDFE